MTSPLPDSATRRAVVKAVAAGGGLLLGVGAAPLSQAQAAGAMELNTFLRIGADNTVTILSDRGEMGTGSHTGYAMLVSEELDPDWSKVRVETADSLARYLLHDSGMRVGGSDAVAGAFDSLRQIGAAAREMLKSAAAQAWSVPVGELRTAQGVVHHDPTGRRAAYGDLAAAAARLPVPAPAPLRDPASWTIIGSRPHRVDAPGKVDGSAVFGIDIAVPGMLTGAIRICPVFGGRLARVDPKPALAVRGVQQVVPLGDAVVVLAEGYWAAHKGVQALDPVWDFGANTARDDAWLSGAIDKGLAEAEAGPADGDVDAALKAAGKTTSATWELPYINHWAIQPVNATAWFRDGRVEIWASVQSQDIAKLELSRALGIDKDEVLVHTPYVGGSFGRLIKAEPSVYAALASRAAGRPVKVIYSREEDTRHGTYRPRIRMKVSAGIDAEGRPSAFKAVAAENATVQDYFRRYRGEIYANLPLQQSDGLRGDVYRIPNRSFAYADRVLGVPVGPWHSVQYIPNGFVSESVIDELAHMAGKDPLAYRREHTVVDAHVVLLDTVARMSGWGKRQLPPGHGLGVAVVSCFGSAVAEVFEVEVRDRAVKIHQVWCAVDCGLAVYPPGVATQMITGLNAGVSAAFFGEINIARGAVVQANFDCEPLIRNFQSPPVAVEIVASTRKIGGAGEGGVPPSAPALANAIFAACGERIRTQPFAKSGWALV